MEGRNLRLLRMSAQCRPYKECNCNEAFPYKTGGSINLMPQLLIVQTSSSIRGAALAARLGHHIKFCCCERTRIQGLKASILSPIAIRFATQSSILPRSNFD